MNLSPEKHTAALARNYFDGDTKFDDDAEPLLDQYTRAAQQTAHAAKCFVRDGGSHHLARARWYEVICQTLEQVLLGYRPGDHEFVMPEPPNFKEM